MNLQKIALISLALLLASAACPAQLKPAPKISETPLPCNLSLAGGPALLGVKLDMPLADARKLFSRGIVSSPIKAMGAGNIEYTAFHVNAIGLPKNISGIPVKELEFFGKAKGNVEWMTIRFADKQTLTPEQLLERVAGYTKIAREMWQQVVNDDKGPVPSWHAECSGFALDFDTFKDFYKLVIYRTDTVIPVEPPPARPNPGK